MYQRLDYFETFHLLLFLGRVYPSPVVLNELNEGIRGSLHGDRPFDDLLNSKMRIQVSEVVPCFQQE